jgi:hypothetical protein
MGERQNTIVCIFDTKSPRITAFNIHEWIYEQLRLQEDDILMIQVDGPRRRVYVKFTTGERLQTVFRTIQGRQEYKHETGEISEVQIELAGLGIRRVRIANLPPEIQDNVIRDVMAKYGDVREVTEEYWSRIYRYKVSTGVRIAEINLKKHVPSSLIMAGNRVLISYDGQPITCYGCNEQGHQYVECPYRRTTPPTPTSVPNESWANVVTRGNARHKNNGERHDFQNIQNETDLVTSVGENSTPSDESKMQTMPCVTPTVTNDNLIGSENTPHDGGGDTICDSMERDKEDIQGGGEGMETEDENDVRTPIVDPRNKIEQPVSRDRNKKDQTQTPTCVNTPDGTTETPPTECDLPHTPSPSSPKRTKKRRTNGDVSSTRDRTRSRPRHKTPLTI